MGTVPVNSRLVRAVTAAGAIAVAGLIWIGYDAISAWRSSAELVAVRRAESAADLLVTALARDMRGVQTSVLSSPHRMDPTDAHDVIASAFARYPYPAAFFAARSPIGPDALLFYTRSERKLPWIPDAPWTAQFPVVVGHAPVIAQTLLTRLASDRGRGYSVFEIDIEGAHYQVIALLTYADPYRERLAEVFGFLVDLDWVRSHYFGELAGQVAQTAHAGPDLVLVIHDDHGRPIASSLDGVTADASERRQFPLAFFDPMLVAGGIPRDMVMRTWTAQAIIVGDPTLRAANQGATRTLLLAAAAVLLLGVAMMFTVRAARASVALAAMRSDFVATVTHELKTPIAAIRAISETLASGRVAAPDAAREYAQMAIHEAKRLTRLIDNLLAYSRVTDVTEVYSFEAVPPDEIIDETLREFASTLAAAGFRVNVDAAQDLPRVRADRTAIALTLANVIDNAIRYSGEGRDLHIRAAGNGACVVFQVTDTGIGIPDAELAHVTRKFFRGRRAPAGGNGLGLSIVQRIVSDHGGSLKLHSVPGQGTTVTITLPAARAA